MTVTIIEDKTIKSFKAEIVEIINGKLSCISVGFNNFIKITPNIKHIFIDGVDVLPYYEKSEIKSASKLTLDEFNELYLGKTIHCKTEELANEFLALAERFGYIWADGVRLTHNTEWDKYKEKTGYQLRTNKKVNFGSVNTLVEFKGGKL